MILRVEDHLSAASRYVARCRLAGDTRPIVRLLQELVPPQLASELAGELLRRSWQPT